MKPKWCISVISVILCILHNANGNSTALENEHSNFGSKAIRKETLNSSEGEFEISWAVDQGNASIRFEIAARTKGFIFFGLARRDGPIDLIIGGIYENGTVYLEDRHSFHESPNYDAEDVLLNSAMDRDADWAIVGGSENATHTILIIQRSLETNDTVEDIPINDDTLKAFWGFGETDDLFYLDPTRNDSGSESVNLLDIKPKDMSASESKIWEVRRTTTITPGRTTSYWCSIFQGPELNEKHHAIRFDPYFKSPNDRQHIHHFVLYKCSAPWDQNVTAEEYFTPFVDSGGAECYESDTKQIPVKYCRDFFYVWAYGGKELLLPNHVGIEMGMENKEFYLMEVHYDNPDAESDLEITGGMTIHYTTELRKNDAGVMMIGSNIEPSLIMPPKSSEFAIFGHCSSNCTSKYLPSEGINVFGILPHSHLLGRKISTTVFQNGKELTKITNDHNFDFQFQQTRILSKEIPVLPGNSLTIQCSYDNRERNGSAVGGLSTREEMCLGFTWYYPKVRMHSCLSSHPMDRIKQFLGIEKLKHRPGMQQPIILSPAELANKTITELMDSMEWSLEKREELQNIFRNGRQNAYCKCNGRKSG